MGPGTGPDSEAPGERWGLGGRTDFIGENDCGIGGGLVGRRNGRVTRKVATVSLARDDRSWTIYMMVMGMEGEKQANVRVGGCHDRTWDEFMGLEEGVAQLQGCPPHCTVVVWLQVSDLDRVG